MKYYYESNEIYNHPKHAAHPRYDIALVKLNKPVTINNEVNNICLPQKWGQRVFLDTNVQGEYVNMGGWGRPTQTLKLAYWRIQETEDPMFSPSANLHIIDNLDPCSVSSKLSI